MATQYWLFKSEPNSFSITDLEKAPHQTTCWDGVRNYQARNYLNNQIAKGDKVFFYHSNAEPPSIVGIAQVTKAGYPDPSALDSKSAYYDERSTKKNPIWYSVDIKYIKTFAQPIALSELRNNPKLVSMALLQKGNRLSIQPVKEGEWKAVIDMTEQN